MSWLNIWSKSSWRSINIFGRNTIILNKQLIPNKKSKQHQTKSLSHKEKKIMCYNSTQHQNHHEKAEWLTQKSEIQKQKNWNKQKLTHWKPRKEQNNTWKKLIKNANPKLWVKFVLAWRTKFLGQPLKTIIKPKLLSIVKNFHQKKVKSAQKRETEPL